MDSLAGQALQLSGGLLAHQQLEEVSFQRSFRALQAPVKQKIEQLCSIGVIKDIRKEIDSRALQQLSCLQPEVAVAILDQLSDARFEGIENKTSYLCGLMSSYKCFGPSLMTREKVDEMLQQLFRSGLIQPSDLDNGCRDALMLLPEHLAQHVVNEFSDAPVSSLRNVSAFFMSIVRRILKEAKKASPEGAAGPAAGPAPAASSTLAMAARRRSVDSALRSHHMMAAAMQAQAQAAASPLLSLPRTASSGAGMVQAFHSGRRSVDLSLLQGGGLLGLGMFGGFGGPGVSAFASDIYGGAAGPPPDPLAELSLMLQEVAMGKGAPLGKAGPGALVSAAQVARPLQQALGAADADLLAGAFTQGLEWLATHDGEVGSTAVAQLCAEAERVLQTRAFARMSRPPLAPASGGTWDAPAAGPPPPGPPFLGREGNPASWPADAAYGLSVFAQSGGEYPGPSGAGLNESLAAAAAAGAMDAVWAARAGGAATRPSRSSLDLTGGGGALGGYGPGQLGAMGHASATAAALQRRSMEEAAIATAMAYRQAQAAHSSFWQ